MSTYRWGRSLPAPGTSPSWTLPPNYVAGIGYYISRRLEADVDIAGVVDRVLPDVGKIDAKDRDPDDAAPAVLHDLPPTMRTARASRKAVARIGRTSSCNGSRLMS